MIGLLGKRESLIYYSKMGAKDIEKRNEKPMGEWVDSIDWATRDARLKWTMGQMKKKKRKVLKSCDRERKERTKRVTFQEWP